MAYIKSIAEYFVKFIRKSRERPWRKNARGDWSNRVGCALAGHSTSILRHHRKGFDRSSTLRGLTSLLAYITKREAAQRARASQAAHAAGRSAKHEAECGQV